MRMLIQSGLYDITFKCMLNKVRLKPDDIMTWYHGARES